MNKPTEVEIQEEIVRLTGQLDRVLPRSMFGDDHVRSITQQILIAQKDLDTEEIYELVRTHGEPGDNDDDNFDLERVNVLEEMRFWLDGEGTAPSLLWEDLCNA